MIASLPPTYIYVYRCWKCGSKYRVRQDTTVEQTGLKCNNCGRSLLRVNRAPGVVTDSTFMAGVDHDDGFGASEWLRKQARAKAKAAGVDVNGAKYCPELCPPGERLSPKAWVKSRSDVIEKAKALGKGVDGPSISLAAPIHDEPDPQPYCVNDEIVDRRVEKLLSEAGQTRQTVGQKEYTDMWHREQKRASGAE